jgi:suppressor of fused-like protein
MNLEAGSLLPLALRGRLKHGRHFTFKTVAGDLAITFLTEAVSGSYATLEHPFALHGPWLQVLVPTEQVAPFLETVQELSTAVTDECFELPKTFQFQHLKLNITILPEEIVPSS